jgi:hypothetical protein
MYQSMFEKKLRGSGCVRDDTISLSAVLSVYKEMKMESKEARLLKDFLRIAGEHLHSYVITKQELLRLANKYDLTSLIDEDNK